MTAAEMEEYTSVVKEANQLLISQKKEIQSKDQQIKDLQELFSAAEKYIEESPCDPDITADQILAWSHYQKTFQSYQQKYHKQ